MKKISWGCTVIGVISIVLSIGGLFLYPEVTGYNLPFQFLLISLKLGSIAVPKLAIFVDTFRMSLFDYIFSIILLISGVGTIRVRPWGKTFAYIYAKSIIFLSMIGMLVVLPGYIIMYNKMIKQGSLSLIPVFFGGGGIF
jgi:hypothetical protein